jgi:hypothetical protein
MLPFVRAQTWNHLTRNEVFTKPCCKHGQLGGRCVAMLACSLTDTPRLSAAKGNP